jgi:hypothetical protein
MMVLLLDFLLLFLWKIIICLVSVISVDIWFSLLKCLGNWLGRNKDFSVLISQSLLFFWISQNPLIHKLCHSRIPQIQISIKRNTKRNWICFFLLPINYDKYVQAKMDFLKWYLFVNSSEIYGKLRVFRPKKLRKSIFACINFFLGQWQKNTEIESIWFFCTF